MDQDAVSYPSDFDVALSLEADNKMLDLTTFRY